MSHNLLLILQDDLALTISMSSSPCGCATFITKHFSKARLIHDLFLGASAAALELPGALERDDDARGARSTEEEAPEARRPEAVEVR